MKAQHLPAKVEWTAPETMPLPVGRYHGATGIQYEVLGYTKSADTVTVMRCDNGVIKHIPHPLARSMFEPVEVEPVTVAGDTAMVVITAALGIVLGLIWWTW